MGSTTGQNLANVLDKNTMAAMNFNVLKRIDPETTELLATAGHVALYDFNTKSSQWLQKGVEGTLFLIRRKTKPYYQYIVLNKKSQDHYNEVISESFKFEHAEKDGRTYILYKTQHGEIVGVWFYDKKACAKVASLLREIAANPATPSSPPVESQSQAPAQSQAPWQKTDPLAAMFGREDTNSASSTQTRTEDSFWDTSRTGVAKEGDPLQQDGRKGSANQPVNTPVSGEPNALERLFGSMRNSTSSVPGNTPTPNKSANYNDKSHAVQKAEASHMQELTPGRQVSGNDRVAAPSPSPQAPPQPALLKPSFFQSTTPRQASTPRELAREPEASTTQIVGPQGGSSPPSQTRTPTNQESFLKLFAPKSGGGAVEAAAGTSSKSTRSPVACTHHAQVRGAVRALAESDAFIEILVQELRKSGLLNQQ